MNMHQDKYEKCSPANIYQLPPTSRFDLSLYRQDNNDITNRHPNQSALRGVQGVGQGCPLLLFRV